MRSVVLLAVLCAACGHVSEVATPWVLGGPAPALADAPEIGKEAGDHIRPLTLERAVEIALRENPSILALQHELAAARGRRTQAGLYPNPELFLQSTDGALYKNTAGAKYVAGLTYLFPIGGRVGAAEDVAEMEGGAAEANLALAKLTLRADVRRAFASVLHRVEVLHLARELAEIVAGARELTASKGSAELHKMEQEQKRLEIGVAVARTELEGARIQLAGLMGRPQSTSVRPVGELATATVAVDLERLWAQAKTHHPRIAFQIRMWDRARFDLELARRQRIPDIGVSAAAATTSDLRENGDVAIELGITVPLPIIDRNQGRIEEAEANVERAAREADAAAGAIYVALADAARRYLEALARARSYRREIVPDARDALERARSEFEAGRYNVLDLLDGYRTYAEVATAEVDALRDAELAAADLELASGVINENPGRW